jgi:hypothetical protein
MHLNELSNVQLILLAMLVSFITSITTGIATVALVGDSPEPVIQTISRIVERTVEKVEEVVPNGRGDSEEGADGPAQVVTKETTIVVKEEDLITEAIDKNSKNTIRIYSSTASTTSASKFLGLGVLIDKDGIIAADLSVTASVQASTTLKAVLNGGGEAKLEVIGADTERNIAVLKVLEGSELSGIKPVVIANSSSLKLGQTVMSIGGVVYNEIGSGIISALITASSDYGKPGSAGGAGVSATSTKPSTVPTGPEDSSGTETNTEEVISIATTLPSGQLLPGTPVFNIFGELVAIAVRRAGQGSGLNLTTMNKVSESVAVVSERYAAERAELKPKSQSAGVQNVAR